MLAYLSSCTGAASICGTCQCLQRVFLNHCWVQVGNYVESLKSGTGAEGEPSIFSGDGGAAVPRRRQLDPEQLRSFETGKLLLPLGGLGTDW